MIQLPISIRTRNRIGYLDQTLRSLLATNVSKENLSIIDDCSDTADSHKYFFEDDLFVLENPVIWDHWLESNLYPKYFGNQKLKTITKVVGIADKIDIIQPDKRLGSCGSLFWMIDVMFKKYPDSEAIIILEDDIVFNAEWYDRMVSAYSLLKQNSGPNGKLGLLSCFNKSSTVDIDGDFGYRKFRKRENGKWNLAKAFGALALLVTKEFYTNSNFGDHLRFKNGGADTTLHGVCLDNGFSIATTKRSYVQHIGFDSQTWGRTRGFRGAKSFVSPYVEIKEINKRL